MKLPSQKLDVQLIAFDLDDTLLNSSLEILPETAAALQKAAARGIFIVLCSGRAENAILPYVRRLNIAGMQQGRYLIALNGSIVFDLHTRLPILSKKVSGSVLAAAFAEAGKYGLPAQVYDPSTIYASRDNEWTQKDANISRLNLKIQDNFAEFLAPGHSKMVIPAAPEKIAEFRPHLIKTLAGAADIFTSKPYFLEIVPADSGKGAALLWLAERLGIPREKTMAFGDGMNDESMLRRAGYGVAMCNGDDSIKEAAAFVTRKSNNDNGIADFLESFVF
ncbi:MAG: Cof-type HAD-IIB family hydrolase [Treponemataceae bacterium]|nr:Cof-type HAD-IIB family hydrolase [Treponemataceae bacterium]